MPAHSLTLAAILMAAIPLADAWAHNCKCRNRGVMYELGQISCLHVDGRNYLARCEMKLNVSSWTEIESGCPLSSGRTGTTGQGRAI